MEISVWSFFKSGGVNLVLKRSLEKIPRKMVPMKLIFWEKRYLKYLIYNTNKLSNRKFVFIQKIYIELKTLLIIKNLPKNTMKVNKAYYKIKNYKEIGNPFSSYILCPICLKFRLRFTNWPANWCSLFSNSWVAGWDTCDTIRVSIFV